MQHLTRRIQRLHSFLKDRERGYVQEIDTFTTSSCDISQIRTVL